jgi:hypothetical protein
MPNIYNPNFNQNVVEVYTEEPGFTGFKGLDWTKLDSIEDILTGVGGTGPNTYLSGIIEDTNIIINNTSGILSDTSSIDNKLFITGDPYPAGVQGTIVFQADLSQQFDAVTTFPEQSTGISNFTASGSNGLILNANSSRRELRIQNLDTGVLYVKYGSGANSSSFNFILSKNTSVNAGDGGTLNDQGYFGPVSVSGLVTPRYISWERTNINKTPLA